MPDHRSDRFPALSRRQLVKGLAAGGLVTASPALLARATDGLAVTRTGTAPVLSGTEFDLTVAETAVDFTGRSRRAITINGCLPAPTLRMCEGDEVTIRVHNRLREVTSIHWHGILLPYTMDGVPGISFPGIAPGETFTYRFRLRQSGSYWYHSHSGSQEQLGMYGSLVVEPRDGSGTAAIQDHTLLFSDWMDADPERVFAQLKVHSDYYNFGQPTVPQFLREAGRDGVQPAWDRRAMWNRMRMNPTDLSDLSGAVLTYLCNGRSARDAWTGLIRPGEALRLRCVNGSANTFFDVRIPGLPMTVVQADGVAVEPVTVDEFRFGPGQTYDVVVRPKEDACTVFAQSMDRSGFACATLAAREGLRAPVPAPDARQWLSMTDMMGSMQHGAQGGMDHGSMDQGSMDHGSMDHGSMGHGSMDHAGMDHAGMAHGSGAAAPRPPVVRHASSEFGPSVDMRVDTPRTNLDDPGIGLRGNGRRVLTLADLHTAGGPLDPREPGRELELHLTGHMERYSWSLDGLEFASSTPVHFRHGERLRVILHNDTMMTHPMHLHGLWSELEAPDGGFQARLHTIPVQPAQRISFLVDASEPGRWAWHCHLMLHMHAGMFREVVVS